MSESEEFKFIGKYFSIVDCEREGLFNVYDKNAICCWNGIGLHGIAEIMKFFKELPFCKHELHVLDVQPVSSTDGTHFLISAGGLLTFNDTKTCGFQSFLIVKKFNGNLFILNNSVYIRNE